MTFVFKQKLKILLGVLVLFLSFSNVQAGTVLSSHKYAWSNNVGYINFENVIIGNNALSGTAWSANKGFIKFDPALGGVLNDGAGNLSGFAWGEQLGWIDFEDVSISPTTGKFSGTATGTLVGTITFDCPNYCDVETDWRQIIPVVPSGGGGGGGMIMLPDINVPTLPDTGVLIIDQNSIIPPQVFNQIFREAFVSASKESSKSESETTSASLVLSSIQDFALFDVTVEPVLSAQPNQLDTSRVGFATRVAPGDLLPISVKLSNFGGGKRVDVLIRYSIKSSAGEEIYSASETVAVETTANFVKTIQIPFGTIPGTYLVQTSIFYDGQLVPATTEFSFEVEKKIFGLFKNDFFLYGGLTFLICIFMLVLGYLLIKHRRKTRFMPFDYSEIFHKERVFYELISDTIMEMRQQVGEGALNIARQIDGLEIDEKTGRILKLTGSPSKIIAELVSGYEKALGKKVSFSFRGPWGIL